MPDITQPEAKLTASLQAYLSTSYVNERLFDTVSFSYYPTGRNILDPVAYGAEDLPADKNTSLVFYCSNVFCRKAPSAARRAESMGYRRVQVMSAGISGWLSENLPTESGE